MNVVRMQKNTHLILKGKTGTCIGSQPYVTFFCISASLTGAALLYAQKTLECAEVCPGVMLYGVAGIALYQEMPLNWDNTKRNIFCIKFWLTVWPLYYTEVLYCFCLYRYCFCRFQKSERNILNFSQFFSDMACGVFHFAPVCPIFMQNIRMYSYSPAAAALERL